MSAFWLLVSHQLSDPSVLIIILVGPLPAVVLIVQAKLNYPGSSSLWFIMQVRAAKPSISLSWVPGWPPGSYSKSSPGSAQAG